VPVLPLPVLQAELEKTLMLWRIAPWAIALFVAYYILSEPARFGHFLAWLFFLVLHACGRMAIAADAI